MTIKKLSLSEFSNNLTKGAMLVAISLFSFTGIVKAEEITVSGNGAASSNEISSSSTQTTSVQQSNSSEVTNTVQVNSDTGTNSTNNNTGGNTAIQTGDVNTAVSVTNAGNTNNATTGTCCQASSDGQATITGNGAGSSNNVNVNTSSTTTIQSISSATITNTINGTANTGNNSSSNNTNGNVTIKTGAINIVEQIRNGPLNVNNVEVVGAGTSQETNNFIVKISGNGAGSVNTINIDNNKNNTITTNNTANILNESLWILNTGYNIADNNTNGNVSILSGGINLLVDVINSPINVNTVTTSCDCQPKPTPEIPSTPTTSTQPSTPAHTPTTGSSTPDTSTSSSGVGGAVLAAAVGKILPATGGNYSFLFLLLSNALLFLLGVTVRLRSGRSPGSLVIPSL